VKEANDRNIVRFEAVSRQEIRTPNFTALDIDRDQEDLTNLALKNNNNDDAHCSFEVGCSRIVSEVNLTRVERQTKKQQK
jgi:hypothetical protein